MKLFISWSGERSQALGKALAEWIPMVLQNVDPWFSPEAIDKGARWLSELNAQLSTLSAAIVCITPESQAAPWLLFEAGALSKDLAGSRLFTVLFDLSKADVTGPLAHFQHTLVESREEVRSLLLSINKQLETPLKEDRLDGVFDAMWDKLETKVKQIPKTNVVQASPRRSSQDLLEEVVERTRVIERQLESLTNPPLSISSSSAAERALNDSSQLASRAHGMTGHMKVLRSKIADTEAQLREESNSPRRNALQLRRDQLHSEYADAHRKLSELRLMSATSEAETRLTLAQLRELELEQSPGRAAIHRSP